MVFQVQCNREPLMVTSLPLSPPRSSVHVFEVDREFSKSIFLRRLPHHLLLSQVDSIDRGKEEWGCGLLSIYFFKEERAAERGDKEEKKENFVRGKIKISYHERNGKKMNF